MGAKEVSNIAFDKMLKAALKYETEKGPWKFDFGDLKNMLP